MPREGKTKSPAASRRRRPAKSARLEARVTAEQKALIERAAAYEGCTISDFLLHSAQQNAKAVIQQRELIALDASQSRSLVELLLAAPKPNKALRQALRDHRRRVTSR
jgi:uncharacterized protein (DUF1778 family)